jgi:polyisoprenoid-binding protein YceI
MGKGFWVLIIVLVLVGSFFFINSGPSSDDVRADVSEAVLRDVEQLAFAESEKKAIDISKSSFEFEGYGPGKSHVGVFDTWNGFLIVDGGVIVGIEGLINTNSINTGISGLDSHLKSEDFFDVSRFPEIVFVSSSINDGIMKGDLTFHGVTKEITFPVEINDGVSADFLVDTGNFNFGSSAVNKEVRIGFDFTA